MGHKKRTKQWRHFHAVMTVFWGVTMIPTWFVFKTLELRYVAWMSEYANMVGHWSAYQGARAEDS